MGKHALQGRQRRPEIGCHTDRVAADRYQPGQHVTHRNRLFVLVPSLILAVLLALLGWEVVRINLSEAARQEMPWQLTFLGVAPAASLSGVFAGLLLARGQFARSVRPALGWTGGWQSDEGSGAGASEQRWVVKVYNGGSGLGVVRQTWYLVALAGESAGSADWVDLEKAKEQLQRGGLAPGRDFSLIQLGVGHPLVSSTKPKDGYEIFRLREDALPRVSAVDMRLSVVDMVGDYHERYMELLRGAHAELVPAPQVTPTEPAETPP